MDKPETIEARRRLAAEGQARIDEFFASEAFRRCKEEEDRALRAKERRAAAALKKKQAQWDSRPAARAKEKAKRAFQPVFGQGI